MGKCKVIPFRKPNDQRRKSLFEKIFHKLGLNKKKHGRSQAVVVRGFGPGALRVSSRDQKA